MKRLWIPVLLFAAALLLNVGELAYHYPQLPQRVASHFNAGGQADGWTTKSEFAWTWLAVLGMLAFMFGMTIVVMSVAPVSTFNLPNKAHWAAPERADETRRMMIERMLWFMGGLMLFVAYLLHGAIAFNLKPGGQLSIWMPLGVFLAFTAVWCAEMFWRFGRIPRDAESE